MRLLMELRPAMEGFAGIPQETRLLFAFLQSAEKNIQVDGLLNTFLNPYRPRYSRKEPIFRAYEQGKYILQIYEPWVPKTHLARFASFPGRLLRQANHLMKSALGMKFEVTPFDSEMFSDFIWQRIFSKTLPTDLFQNVISRSYFMNSLGWNEMHRAGRLTGIYPTLDTRSWDFALMQTPFPANVSPNTKLLIRYHDAIPLYLPQHISDARRHMSNHFHALRLNAERAWFVCTSTPVVQDLLRLLPEVEKRTIVIPDIMSDAFFPDRGSQNEVKDLIRRYVAPETSHQFYQPAKVTSTTSRSPAPWPDPASSQKLEYLMAVATIEPRKNYARLLSAWEEVYARSEGAVKLIIVGWLGWHFQGERGERVYERMKIWAERGALFHLSGLPSAALRKLYSSALAVICPSISEGFDYSGVESMQCNTLVIASDIRAHRAVYGDAALYFNPYSISELVSMIDRALKLNETNETRMLLIQRGGQIAAQYSANVIIPQWHAFLNSIA